MTGTLDHASEFMHGFDVDRSRSRRLRVESSLDLHSEPDKAEHSIEYSARLRLRTIPYSELHRLDVKENALEVILSGVVSSFFLKQLAQESVRPVLAGRVLRNLVVVRNASSSRAVHAETPPADQPPVVASEFANGDAKPAVSKKKVLIATGKRDLAAECEQQFRSQGLVVQQVDSGIELMSELQSTLPDVLVLADPLPWGGTDGVLQRAHELGLLQRFQVVHVASPEVVDRLPAELWGQLAEVILGNDITAAHVSLAVTRALAR